MLLLSAPRIAGLLPAQIKPPVVLDSVLKSPYPYFGGKATVARIIWQRFGDVPNYVEPFFGSGAVLLSRPVEHLQRPRTETVNDKDGMIANFWRAVKYAAESVAEYADWPVNENDLHARHVWLVGQKESLAARLEGCPEYFDAKIAGWWVWGASCWLGSGFCSGKGGWSVVDGELIKVANGAEVSWRLPRIGNAATGVHRTFEAVSGTRPHLAHGNTGIAGVYHKRPHLWSQKGITRQSPRLTGSQGVVRQVRHLAHGRQGIDQVSRQIPELKSLRGDSAQRTGNLVDYFLHLQARLRRVRVCSGDWSRVSGPAVTTGNGLTAVLLDPPYSEDRDEVYNHDSMTLAHEVRAWAITNGDNPQMRIAYCGYEDGFEWPAGWTAYRWTANGGYGNQGDGRGKENKKREVIWFSPHCLPDEKIVQLNLFDEATL